MGAISANKPAIHLVTGPMMPGSHKGVRIGACTDCRNNWAKFRAGTIDIEDIADLNEELAPTVSHLALVFCICEASGSPCRLEHAELWARHPQWPAYWQGWA
jgi:hypothetical protein